MFKIKTPAFILASLLMLTGCVTSGEKAALSKLEGKPISDLVKKYGEPLEVKTKDDGDTYIWEHTEKVALQNAKQGTAFTQNTIDVKCRLTAYTSGGDKTVTKASTKGDYYVCAFFTHRLR